MKSNLIPSTTRVTRFAVALLTAVLLTSSVGCGGHVDHVGEDTPLHEDEPKRSWPFFGGKDTVSQSDFESLEADFKDLKAEVIGGNSFLDNVALWQAVAALFVVLAGFALVGGAALGSRARRERQQQQQHQHAAVNLDEARS